MYAVNHDCMCQSTYMYQLKYGRHIARPCPRRWGHAPAIHVASHADHLKRVVWFSISTHACTRFCSSTVRSYSAPLGGPWASIKKNTTENIFLSETALDDLQTKLSSNRAIIQQKDISQVSQQVVRFLSLQQFQQTHHHSGFVDC